MVAAAKFQSEQRFGPSLALIQSPNLILLLAALLTAGDRRAGGVARPADHDAGVAPARHLGLEDPHARGRRHSPTD